MNTSEIAKKLEISVPTARNYAKYLEGAGHTFDKTNHARVWTVTELEYIEKAKELQAQGVEIREAFQKVVNKEQNISVVSEEAFQMSEVKHTFNDFKRSMSDMLDEKFKSYLDHSDEAKLLHDENKSLKDEVEKLTRQCEDLKKERDTLKQEINQIYDMNMFQRMRLKK